MTASDRELNLARARRVQCAVEGCDETLPVRVSCVPRHDGMYDVRSVVDERARRKHLLAAHPSETPFARWPKPVAVAS